MRNISNGTGGRVLKVIDCPGGRVPREAAKHRPPGVPGGSTGHWGSLAVMVARRPPAVRPVRSIAYAAIAYFLGSCCAFRQLLLAFWANRGFWLPAARTGAGGRSEPRARWEGPYGTRGGRAAAAAAAAGARPNRRRRRKRRRGRGVPRGAAGCRCGLLRGALAAAGCRRPLRGAAAGRCGVPLAALARCGSLRRADGAKGSRAALVGVWGWAGVTQSAQSRSRSSRLPLFRL